jgi:RNA polymerase primary sigma factor
MTRTRKIRTDSVQSPLETYIRDITEVPLLSADEEKQLAYRIAEGDSEARDYMVRANLRLVVNLARGYTGKGLALQDLIAEGNLGLLRAIEAFDPSMNTRFSTYASFWIKQAIRRGLINTAKTVRIPAYMVNLLTKWRRAMAKLQEDLGRPPTQEEVAASLKLTHKQLKIIKGCIDVNIFAPKTDETETGLPLGEMLIDGRARTPNCDLIDADERRQVLDELDRMDQREAAILRMHFGLDDDNPKTLREIGERLGLTRERVRQIEHEALSKLSDRMQPV